jgi:CRP/FNR family transcriptional regulator
MRLIKQQKQLSEVMERKGRFYKLPKGQIFQSSDTRQMFNLVKSGYVKRYLITNDGSIRVQGIWGPGDSFPLTIAFKILFGRDIYDGPEIYHYQSMTPVEIYMISQVTLAEYLKGNSAVVKDLLFESGKRLQSNIQRLENVGLKTSYHKVAHQLLHFAQEFGTKKTRGVSIGVPLSHQDLADNLSLTRETVTNSMKKLRSRKLIDTSSKYIVVTNMEGLEKEAYS